MENSSIEIDPAPEILRGHLHLVQDYVKAKPGSHAALMVAARREPEELTMSIVALGTVLLDIAAGAFHLTPEEMLDKVAHSIEGPSA